MNWLAVPAFAVASFGGFAAGWAFLSWNLKRYAELAPPAPPGVFRLTFETRDAGRTWTHEGREVQCSPLSDRLQDAWTNVDNELPPETVRFRDTFIAGKPIVIPMDLDVFNKVQVF